MPSSIHEPRTVISLLDYLMDRVLISMCAVPRRTVFFGSVTLILPEILPMQFSVPFLTSSRAPMITGIVVVSFHTFPRFKASDMEIEKGQAGLPQTQQLQTLYYWDVHGNFHFFRFRQLFTLALLKATRPPRNLFLIVVILNLYLISIC